MGSEMCIRDSPGRGRVETRGERGRRAKTRAMRWKRESVGDVMMSEINACIVLVLGTVDGIDRAVNVFIVREPLRRRVVERN